MNSASQPPSQRARVRRVPDRGCYDRKVIHGILDEGLVAHVGLVSSGEPYVLPMAYVRDEDRLLLHGSTASRLMQNLATGAPACVTVTLLDGLVLARSAFHHSMNYRSVVALGRARPLLEPAEKLRARDRIVEGMLPGRKLDARSANAQELKATLVLEFPLSESTAKIRQGPPVDDEDDLDLPVWAGIIPLSLVAGTPLPGDDVPETMPAPGYLVDFKPDRRQPPEND
jgi:nitroimidazol reductase NimA-like FMN-containing flavoprotein (pyridoxamine 5'-phosphate oxidase superfamily)